MQFPAARSPRARQGRRPKSDESLTIAGIRFTHPDRVMYPDLGLTKGELGQFYAAIADRVLPHVEGRPLSVIRCPQGLDEGAVREGVHQTGRGSSEDTRCFFQKHANITTPASIARVPVREGGVMVTYLAAHEVPELLALIQYSVLELHPWGSRVRRPDHPDRMIFDLDPGPDVPFRAVIDAAREVQSRLERVGLESYVKTTGGKGLHVVVPLAAKNDWDEVKGFARALAERMSEAEP